MSWFKTEKGGYQSYLERIIELAKRISKLEAETNYITDDYQHLPPEVQKPKRKYTKRGAK